MKDKNPGGRPASVTPEQVFDAANEVVNRGDSPNFASVFALVNGGTRGYINKHLMAWDIAREKSGQSQIPMVIMELYQKAYSKGGHLGSTEYATSFNRCGGQVISDTSIDCCFVDSRSKALGDKLPSLECSRVQL